MPRGSITRTLGPSRREGKVYHGAPARQGVRPILVPTTREQYGTAELRSPRKRSGPVVDRPGPDRHDHDLEFEDGAAVLDPAIAAAEHIRALKVRARAAKIPVIYANDNFGRWRSDFREVVAHCLEDGVRGEPLARRLALEPDDYFVLKPKHSAFFATTMETLLEYLGVERLILTGISTHICVAFTAIDAFMRGYELIVPEDCVASAIRAEHDQALAYLRRVCSADTTRSDRLDPGRLRLLRKGAPF